MTIKQQTNHRAIHKVCHLHIAFFIPFIWVTLCQFYSCTTPVAYTKKSKLRTERKGDFLYAYGCFRVSCYVKGGRKSYL